MGINMRTKPKKCAELYWKLWCAMVEDNEDDKDGCGTLFGEDIYLGDGFYSTPDGIVFDTNKWALEKVELPDPGEDADIDSSDYSYLDEIGDDSNHPPIIKVVSKRKTSSTIKDKLLELMCVPGAGLGGFYN